MRGRVDAHNLQCVNLFGNTHTADFRRDARAEIAHQQQADNRRTELHDDGGAGHEAHRPGGNPAALDLEGRLHGNHAAHGERHDADNQHGADAHRVHLEHPFLQEYGPFGRFAEDLAQEDEVFAKGGQRFSEHLFQFDVQFVELFGVDGGGGGQHSVAAGVVLRERDKVADAVAVAQNGAKTVETEGDTTVRRGTEFEGVDQESELALGLLFGEIQGFEHALLQFRTVDTDGAATDFGTVDNQVVGIGQHLAGTSLEPVLMLGFRCGKRVVHSVIALGFLVPLQQREIDHPHGLVLAGLAQTEAGTHFQTQLAHLLARLHRLAGKDEDEVAGVCIATFGHGLEVVLGVEFIDRGFVRTILIAKDIDQTSGAHARALHKFGEVVQLLAGIVAAALGLDADDEFGLVENLELLALQHIVELHETHVETGIKQPEHLWVSKNAEFGISMLKEYYGQGLGTRLMQLMENWAKERHLHSITGEVRAGNRRAISLYLKQGFEICGHLKETALIDNVWHDEYIIQKIIKE